MIRLTRFEVFSSMQCALMTFYLNWPLSWCGLAPLVSQFPPHFGLSARWALTAAARFPQAVPLSSSQTQRCCSSGAFLRFSVLHFLFLAGQLFVHWLYLFLQFWQYETTASRFDHPSHCSQLWSLSSPSGVGYSSRASLQSGCQPSSAAILVSPFLSQVLLRIRRKWLLIPQIRSWALLALWRNYWVSLGDLTCS